MVQARIEMSQGAEPSSYYVYEPACAWACGLTHFFLLFGLVMLISYKKKKKNPHFLDYFVNLFHFLNELAHGQLGSTHEPKGRANHKI